MKRPRKSLFAFFMTICLMIVIITTALPSYDVKADSEETIVFVHTNDVHGNVDVEPYVKAVADTFKGTYGNKNVLTLSAGDVFAGGQSIAHLTEGESIVEIMNAAGYDAMTFGNNDLNLGGAQLLKLASKTNFPILGANFFSWGTDNTTELAATYNEGDQPLDDYQVFTTESGCKIGIFGLTTTMMSNNPVYEYYYTEGTIITAEKYVDILKNVENCDIIIALGHTGWSDNLTSTVNNDVNSYQLATQVDGIDLVIDGHSHSIIGGGAGYTCDNDTLIVQTGSLGNNIGVVTLTLSESSVTSKSAYQIAESDFDDYTPDANTLSVISKWQAELDAYLGETISRTNYFLNGERVSASADAKGIRMAEQNLGNLITDALRTDSGSDVAMFPGVCIRSSIEIGDITLEDLYSVFANGGNVYQFECSGEELISYLQKSIASAANGQESPNFEQISGLSFVYSSDGEILSVTMNDGSELDLTATYTLLYGSIATQNIEGSTLKYSGYDDLVSVLSTYLKSDSYNTENYANVQGRILEGKDITSVILSEIESYNYTGSSITPLVELIDGDYVLTEGIDYSLSYDNNVNAGTASITIKGKGSYARTINTTFLINKSLPSYSLPSGLIAKYGQKLSDVKLPSGYSWEDDINTSVGNVGTNSFTIKYTPEDTANYNTVSNLKVNIVVSKAETPVVNTITTSDKIIKTTESPTTDDNTPIVLWLYIFILSALGFLTVFKRIRSF